MLSKFYILSPQQKNSCLLIAISILILVIMFLSIIVICLILILSSLNLPSNSNLFENKAHSTSYNTIVSISNFAADEELTEDGLYDLNKIKRSSGIGILLDNNGWVLTAKHVITHSKISDASESFDSSDFDENHKKLFLINPPDEEYIYSSDFERIVTLENIDLALIKVNFPPDIYDGLSFCKIEHNKNIILGKEVFLIRTTPTMSDGYKFVRNIIRGNISGYNQFNVNLKREAVFFVNLPAYPGDSGGPILNSKTGNILGIVFKSQYLQTHEHIDLSADIIYKSGISITISPILIRSLLEKANLNPDDYFVNRRF